ncbi:MAG: MBL fold metallo-hydrolase [Chloroflexi bacterium]|nr:MBL fold metallo-hydrolase [Chloroflexota bacterium]
MKIKWLGHAAFLITSEKGTRIITDPYRAGSFEGAIGYGRITDVPDVVLVTHDHEDHNYVVGLPGKPMMIKGTGTHRAGDMECKGISAYHDTSHGRERGIMTIFRFSVDGMALCHVGDLGHALTEEQLSELGAIDVLFMPVGGLFTIDAQGATQLVKALKPRIAIPMHFKTPKCGFPLAGVDEFLTGKENVRRLLTSEVELKKEDLPQATQIIVLQHAL